MNESTLIGSVVIGLAAVVSLFFAVGKPVINLNKTLMAIQGKLDQVIADLTRTDTRVTQHGKEIDNLSRKVDNHEYRISTLEECNKIDHYGA